MSFGEYCEIPNYIINWKTRYFKCLFPEVIRAKGKRFVILKNQIKMKQLTGRLKEYTGGDKVEVVDYISLMLNSNLNLNYQY